MVFDPKKPVQTRDGRKARIICVDGKFDDEGLGPILALATQKNGNEQVLLYNNDGTCCYMEKNSPHDLVNIPEKCYRNIYNNAARLPTTWKASKLEAELGRANNRRIECVLECDWVNGKPENIRVLPESEWE